MFGTTKREKKEGQAPLRFLDSKKDGPSRAKYLKQALEERSVHDRRLLLDTHSFEIFHLFHELIAAAELAVPSSGGRYSDVEIECALWLLEQVLTYLPDKIAQKWQFNAIGNAFKQCLHPQNGIPLRKIALRLFLLWYQVLGAAIPETASTLDPIFAVLVPNLPLPSGASSLKQLEDLCSNFGTGQPYTASSAAVSGSTQGWVFFRNKPLAPPGNADKSAASQTPANLLQMFMEKLLESIAKDCTRLEWFSGKKEEMHKKGLMFLLAKLRKYYVDLCWPDMATDGVTFSSKSSALPTELAPPHRQLLGIRDPWIVCRFCIVRWTYNYAFSHRNVNDSMNEANNSPEKASGSKLPHSYENIRNALLGDMDMTCLTLSILREGLLLPFQCHGVMNRVIRTLREWIFQQVTPPFLRDKFGEKQEGPQIAIRTLIRILCWFYYNPYLHYDDKRDPRTVMSMSNKILGTLKDLASPQRPPLITLTVDTWNELLNCLLRVVSVVVPSHPSSEDEEKNFTRALAVHLFQTLLITWVLASAVCKLPIPTELWNQMTDILGARTTWEDLIDEWSKVMETTTRALSLNFYQIDLMNAPLDRQKGRKQIRESGESRTKVGAASAPAAVPSSSTTDTVLTPRELYNICQPAVAEAEFHKKPKAQSPPERREPIKIRSISDVDRPKSEIVNSNFDSETPFSYERNKTTPSEHTNGTTPNAEPTGSDVVSMESASVSSADFGIMEEKDAEKTSLFGDDRKYLTPSPVSGDCAPGEGSFEDLSEVIMDDGGDITPREENLPGNMAPDGGMAWAITWRRMVGCLGNLSKIPDPNGRLKTVQVLGKMTATLQRIRDNLGVSLDGQSTPDPPIHIPPVQYVVPYLLAILNDASSEFRDSRMEAFKILSKIYFQRHDLPIPDTWLAQFQNSTLQILQHGNEREKDIVLSHFWPFLMSNETTGIENVIPACNSAVSSITSSYPATAIMFSVQIAAFPIGIQQITQKFHEMQGESVEVLTTAVMNPGKLQWKVLGQAINGITTFLFNQIAQDSKLQLHVSFQSALDSLVKNLHNSSEVIANQVCEAIALLLQKIFSRDASNGNQVVQGIGLRLMDVLGYEFYRRSGEVGCAKDKEICERILCCLIEICCRKGCKGSHSDLLPSLSQVLSGKAKGSLQSCARTSIGQLLVAKNQSPLPEFNLSQFGSSEVDPDSTTVSISLSKTGKTLSVASDNDHVSTAITRTLTEKHVWSVSEMLTKQSPRKPPEKHEVNQWLLTSCQKKAPERRNETKPKNEESNTFGTFLKNLIKDSPECQTQPSESQSLPHQNEVETTLRGLSLHRCSPSLKSSDGTILKAGIRRDTPQSKSLGPWWNLIGDLSMIAWEKQTLFAQLRENPEKLSRELKHLDNLQSRETFKVAVIYVAQGQEDKMSILSNSNGSTDFEKFVAGLGWEVDLTTHSGYMGGLPPEGTAPYYTDLNTQILFHVSTRLSFMDSNKKTKHLGNDEVHIVWSEHYRDYRRAIFPTEFCDVLIVIYPMKRCGLFRIHLECRDEDSMTGLGPIFNGAVLSWSSLSFLVRATALNASRMKRHSVQGWEPSWEQRSRALQTIRDQMAQPSSFSDLLGVLFGGVSDEDARKKPQLKLPKVRDESRAVAV